MPIQAADLLLDILFDFSADFLGNLRRQKNSFDDLGRRTSSLVVVEQPPGRASAQPKNSGLLRGRIISRRSHQRFAYLCELQGLFLFWGSQCESGGRRFVSGTFAWFSIPRALGAKCREIAKWLRRL